MVDETVEERKKNFKMSTFIRPFSLLGFLNETKHLREEYAACLRKKKRDSVLREKRMQFYKANEQEDEIYLQKYDASFANPNFTTVSNIRAKTVARPT